MARDSLNTITSYDITKESTNIALKTEMSIANTNTQQLNLTTTNSLVEIISYIVYNPTNNTMNYSLRQRDSSNNNSYVGRMIDVVLLPHETVVIAKASQPLWIAGGDTVYHKAQKVGNGLGSIGAANVTVTYKRYTD